MPGATRYVCVTDKIDQGCGQTHKTRASDMSSETAGRARRGLVAQLSSRNADEFACKEHK